MSIVAQLCRYLEPKTTEDDRRIPVPKQTVRQAIQYAALTRSLGMKAPEHERFGDGALRLKWHTCAYDLDVLILPAGPITVNFATKSAGQISHRLVLEQLRIVSNVRKPLGCEMCIVKSIQRELSE